MLESSISGFLISFAFEEQCNFTRLLPVHICLTKPMFCLASFLLLLWIFPTWQASYFIGPVDHVIYDLGIVFLTALVLFV